MTDEYDYKAALEGYNKGWSVGDLLAWDKKYKREIKLALRLADRLSSGEVSIETHKAGQAVITKPYHSMQSEEIFKAMTAQMIAEVSDER